MSKVTNEPPHKTDIADKKKPREWPNAGEPGSYQIATKAGKTIISPGDVLTFDQYITGYGNIMTGKIQCYISSDVFLGESSYVESGLSPNDHDIEWGRDKNLITDDGFRLSLQGISIDEKPEWGDSTMFVDASPNINSVLTETKRLKAPFTYSLATKKNAASGMHYIDFYLTYFNGREWITNKERVDFKIKNFFERHNKSITWLAIIASVTALLRLAVIPAAQWLYCILL